MFDIFGGSMSPESLPVPGPNTIVRITQKPRERSGHQEAFETSEAAPRSAPRTDGQAPRQGDPRDTQDNIPPRQPWWTWLVVLQPAIGQISNPSATVGLPPTAARWTNSPPPHSSIHWDDHITGMITSTNKNAKP